jgi:hypothetical protein
MTDYSYPGPLILFIILFFSVGRLLGQTKVNSMPDSINYISFPAFFEKLQKDDSVYIFYKPEWFDNKK